MMKLVIATCAFLMAINSVNCLKCYMCSSDAAHGTFCKDPFEKDKLTPIEKSWAEKDCSSTTLKLEDAGHMKPVCRKLVQEVNGAEVIQRQCYYQDIHEPNDRCKHDETPANIRTKFCETCDSDYCNGSGKFMLSTTGLIMSLIPALIAKLFLL